MIKQSEIQKIANRNKLRDKQIEKDYIISWILYFISQNKILYNNLIFKGGTVLKKAYFPDYRFSEDLDFTLFNNGFSNDTIFTEFDKISELINEKTRIVLKRTAEHEYKSSQSINFYLAYIGPLGGNLGSKDLKIDITRNEVIEFDIVNRKIITEYSDLFDYEFEIRCYQLAEILIEKMTALMGRTIPRDLFDLWYLLEYEQIDIQNYYFEFERKAINKGHNPNELVNKTPFNKVLQLKIFSKIILEISKIENKILDNFVENKGKIKVLV